MTTLTKKPIRPPAKFRLELCFDFDQITEVLQYHMWMKLPGKRYKKCKLIPNGPLAGTFNFRSSDEIEVSVIGTQTTQVGKGKRPTPAMNVYNCTIVSIAPAISVSEDKYNLSLFDFQNACASISDWTMLGEQKKTKDDRKLKQRRFKAIANDPLIVLVDYGQWAMSGYLSVAFAEEGGPTKNIKRRLYYFDPEGSADGGTGGD